MMERSYCQGYLFIKIEGDAYEKRSLSGFLGFVLLICSVSVPLSAYDNAINESDTSSGLFVISAKKDREKFLCPFFIKFWGVWDLFTKRSHHRFFTS